jgi:hypothetical protein
MIIGQIALTMVVLTTIIGMTSIVLSLIYENEPANQHIPTQPTQKSNRSTENKLELEKDVENFFVINDDNSDVIITGDNVEYE